MNLRDLRYLVALADYCHFGKAAENCFVSQPTLSMQIKKLEDTLGIQLLERSNRSVLLTAAGNAVAERARNVLQQVDEMKEIARQAKDPKKGELTIGIIPTVAPYLLPHIMPEISKKFPKLSIYLFEEKTDHLIEKLKHGKLDVILLALPIVEPHFVASLLYDEEFVLAVPSTHAWAKRKRIKLNNLENESLLLLDDGHCMREQALAFCHQANASEMKSFRATSLETLRHMVSAKMGITLIPKLACRPKDDISYLSFSSPKPKRAIGMVWRSSSAKKELLENLAGLIKIQMASERNINFPPLMQ